MSAVTAHAPTPHALEPAPRRGNIITRPSWWRALIWTLIAASIGVLVPVGVRTLVGWDAWQYQVVSAALMLTVPLGFMTGIGCFDY